MKRFGTAATLSLCIAALGVILFLLAVSGALFEGSTRVGDVGMWSVVLVLVAVGLLGFWAAMAEKRDEERKNAR